MNSINPRYLIIVLILVGGVFYVYNLGSKKEAVSPTQNTQVSVEYDNKEYGFVFDLPKNWLGYTTVFGQWEGYGNATSSLDKPVAQGVTISIRNPLWTKDVPRQDIPIMVFTLAQWEKLQKEEFHIGTAPIGPKELGRNNVYVFALPARYNYAFPVGFEEVEQVLSGNPLRAYKK